MKNINFHIVHHLCWNRPDSRRLRPIELGRSRSRELRRTDFSVNYQFPKDILERCKVLFPIQRKFMEGGSRAVVMVNKLFPDDLNPFTSVHNVTVDRTYINCNILLKNTVKAK